MAWNRPSEEKKVEVEKRGGQRNVHLKGLVAGAIVVIGAGIAAWWIFRSDDNHAQGAEHKARGMIREVTPAQRGETPRPREEKPKVKTQAERDAAFIRACEAQYGADMPDGLKTHLYYLKNPPKNVYQGMVSFPYLKHTSERDIATLLSVEPGTFMLNPQEYGAQFDEDFISAMVDAIEIEPDDSDEVKEEKRQIEAMKKEIAALVRQTGKKPSELMTEHSRLMYDLGRFEQQLAEDLRAAESNPDLTDADVKDYFAAANVLRKKKGLDERPIPDLTERALELRREARLRLLDERRKAEAANKEGQ